MALILHTDYDIEFNKWNDAIITYHPKGWKFIGCGRKEKWQNLYNALDAMRKVILVKDNEIQETCE